MRLASLGLFVFEFATWPFEDLKRRTDWTFANNPRVGARDAHQFVGQGQEQVQIAGRLCPEAAGSFSAIGTLRAMADTGEEHQLVLGTGEIWGSFVIVGMDEGRKHLMDDGTPRLIDFTLDLLRVA